MRVSATAKWPPSSVIMTGRPRLWDTRPNGPPACAWWCTDGYEVARRIRALPAGAAVRLIALTGYGQPEDRSRALREGFDAQLVKPMTPDSLRKILSLHRY